jgi:GTP-binding protein
LDGINGLTNDDIFIFNILKKTNKPTIIIANKLENNKEVEPSI